MNLRLALTLLEACEENLSYYTVGNKRHDQDSRLPKDTILKILTVCDACCHRYATPTSGRKKS